MSYPIGQHVAIPDGKGDWTVKEVLGIRTRPGFASEVCIGKDTGGNLAHWLYINELACNFTALVLFFDWQELYDSQVYRISNTTTLEAANAKIMALAEAHNSRLSADLQWLIPGHVTPLDLRSVDFNKPI